MDRENTSLYLQNLVIMQENKALLAQLKQRCYQQQEQQQQGGGGGGPSAGSASGGGHSVSADAGNLKAKAAGKQPK